MNFRESLITPYRVPDSYAEGNREVMLEAGVRYFARIINMNGGRTVFSCEGHAPRHDWYIACEMPHELAVRIAQATGALDVIIWRVSNGSGYLVNPLRAYCLRLARRPRNHSKKLDDLENIAKWLSNSAGL